MQSIAIVGVLVDPTKVRMPPSPISQIYVSLSGRVGSNLISLNCMRNPSFSMCSRFRSFNVNQEALSLPMMRTPVQTSFSIIMEAAKLWIDVGELPIEAFRSNNSLSQKAGHNFFTANVMLMIRSIPTTLLVTRST